ncbi:amino acid ABC transporter substrate-binding protein (PAAT family) [Malaciobacter marinus]|uniref:Amino acid ABC transporter substrate-binding protein (PAAT family) n=1 Tax=Malaciobacter marinus TaxID=505249 RepID=A0AB36ZXK1_9BACT|nr:ABC transporter substrate-binding protein [Malaciobacter marinus]PPK61952.1 amino acid ABC transporter substrate-binding protein (PAAT family) [Malaciobacter marinus]
MKKFIAGFLLCFSMFSYAQEDVITVGLCAAYPPFESRDAKSGEIVGFDIDLANEIGKVLNKKIVIKDAEWQALLGGLKTNQYDMILSAMSRQEAGENNVNLSNTYYLLNDVIVVKKQNDKITSKEDLKNKIVGVQLGSGSEQVVDKLEGLKKVARYNYNPEAFLDLKHERIDAVVVGYAYAVKQKNFKSEYKIVDKLAPSELVVVMRKDKDELTKQINMALTKLKSNGVYDKLVQKWLEVK